MTSRQNFLVKAGLGIATLVLVINTAGIVSREGITSLDYHQQWIRQQLYPAQAARLGHILETYIEPVMWQKFREQLFRNWWLPVLVAIWGMTEVVRKRPVRAKSCPWKERTGLWLGLLLAGIIFTWQLATVPPGIYVDEAVTGYNSWSVLSTGRDEYGKAMPILFKYFGSWLPGLNLYFLVPVIQLLGLTELAVRMPAAFLGIGVCLVIYVLIKMKTGDEGTAELGTVFLAIVPWMVFNARLGYEEMLGFILFAAGCGLLYRSLKVKENLKWAILAFSLSSYDAHVFRYLMVLLLPLWLLFNLRTIKKWPREFILGNVMWLVITQIPNLMVIFTPAFWVKQVIYKGVEITRIYHNFLQQLITYFSPVTLFVHNPDIDLQHQIPGMGLFYWWMIVPIAGGVVVWIKNWKQNIWWLTLLVVSIVPAAMSGVFISVQRALPMLLPLSMAMAEGLSLMLNQLDKKKKTGFLFLLLGYSGLLLYRSYFVLLPGLYPGAWNYGYKQLTEVVTSQSDTHFVIDNSRNVRNYILPLFYMQYPPDELQAPLRETPVSNYYYSGEMPDNHQYANLEFRPIIWKEDICKDQVLVGDKLAISEQQAAEHQLIKAGEVRSRTGDLLLQWWRTNPEAACGKI